MSNDSHNSNSPSAPFKIEVAERVKRLPQAYLFGKINALMYQKRRAGADVIDLGMGNPHDPPSDLVIEKLCEAAREAENHGYNPSIGILNLRREVAGKYLRKYGVRLDPESQVIVCLGSKEGFSHACLALLGPGDSAIVPAPSYPAHVYGVTLAAGNAIALEIADPQKYLSNVAYSCQHLYPRPKLVIVNFPHNPSAVTIDPEFYVELVQLAKRYGFMVISDMAYGDIGFDGYQPPSFLATPGALDVGIELTTMSKGYNMAGWRVGYATGNAEMLKALATVKAYYDYGMFLPIQVAAIVALRDTDAAVEEQARMYQRRRDVLVEGLRRLGWDITPPRAGMFVWAKIPPRWTSQMDSVNFAMKLLEEGDIVVSPGGGFGPAGEGFVRMALVENEARLRQALRQIGRCLGTEPHSAAASAVEQAHESEIAG
ncbi:MAG: aminotransferase class I/II-fold pyridoxal phosphate-dependent enzyme [Pirellulales bacterium]|nr:aminotransferase class I/II-fold pyridoxal phosphate-dependent enzyme [Pirellulales bacterium]